MTTLQISPELAQTISLEAESAGLAVEEFLAYLLRRQKTFVDRLKIEQEQQWWLNRPLSERARYEGQFVAIHQQKLVDSDPYEAALYQRIRQKYGKTAVLVMPAEGPREVQIFSPKVML